MHQQNVPENEPVSETQRSLPASAERMTADEAREVIDLWMERRDPSALSDSPSVPDVAEGLDITPQEAQMLLAEVRARRAAKEEHLRQETEQANLKMLAAELMRRQDENTERILRTVRAEARQREQQFRRTQDVVLLTPNTYPEVRALGWKGFTNEAKVDEAEKNTSEFRRSEKTGRSSWVPWFFLLIFIPLFMLLLTVALSLVRSVL